MSKACPYHDVIMLEQLDVLIGPMKPSQVASPFDVLHMITISLILLIFGMHMKWLMAGYQIGPITQWINEITLVQ